MTQPQGPARTGFSLLEVMIATAILAGSAMVLMSLISMGTKYGGRAEDRIAALVQAQSILDENIARMAFEETREQQSGELSLGDSASAPRRSYRISVQPYPWSDDTREAAAMSADATAIETNTAKDSAHPESLARRPSSLVRVTVELFDGGASQGSAEPDPLVALTRIVRKYPSNANAVGGPMMDNSPTQRSVPNTTPLPRSSQRPPTQRGSS